ncbi:MAG TPA: hypothetical protein PLQ76_06595, partial [bacterium]|nr:hypothetical protein [bacterium]
GRGVKLQPIDGFIERQPKASEAVAPPAAPAQPVSPQQQAQKEKADKKPPQFSDVYPGDNAVISGDIGTIRARVTDPKDGVGVNPSSISLLLDGIRVDVQFDERRSEITAYAGKLEPGTHTLQIDAADRAGNTAFFSGSFTIE